MAKLSGKLVSITGAPLANYEIIIIAEKSSKSVVNTADVKIKVAADGSYNFTALPGYYVVMITDEGRQTTTVGKIKIYTDSKDGSLNDYLIMIDEWAATPEVVALIESYLRKVESIADGVSQDNGEAKKAAAAAAVSATESKNSATESKDSASAAKTSETNAKQSETNSANNKNAAADSASAAKVSETNSKQSETNSATNKNAAADSASAAKTSETNSKTSETNSKTSETNSKDSENKAKDYRDAANNFAQASVSGAQASADYASAAKTSETNSKTSETNSKTSETNSKTSETNAKTSETNAAASKKDASDSAAASHQSELNSKASEDSAAESAELARQYQPNTALQLFTDVIGTDTGKTLNDNLPDGVYPVSQDSPGSPLAVEGKVWVTHRGMTSQQTWESQQDPLSTNYARKFFRTGSVSDGGAVTWGEWREHVLMDLNAITKILRGVDSTFTLGADGSNPSHAVTLRQMQQAIAAVSSTGGINGVMSTFIGDVSWWQGSASLIPTGYFNPSGQLSLRSDFPEIWALVDAGALTSTTEANWNSTTNLGYRGMFTKGTVTTGANANFRWPDLNGATTSGNQGLFLRGAASGKLSGEIRESGLPNLTGEAAINLPSVANIAVQPSSGGVFVERSQVSNNLQTATGIQASGSGNTGLKFDASKSSAVYQNGVTEVRPPSVSGIWIMRAKGTFSAQTSFNVYTSDSALVPNSTKWGGAVRSVYKYGNTEAGVWMKSKVTTNASAETRRVMELGVDGGSGIVEIDGAGSIVVGGNINMASGAITSSGQIAFSSVANARQTLQNMGFTNPASTIFDVPGPARTMRIMCASAVVTMNAASTGTLTFPTSFPNVCNAVIAVNGDRNTDGGWINIIGQATPTGFNFRASDSASIGVRINYIAVGY